MRYFRAEDGPGKGRGRESDGHAKPGNPGLNTLFRDASASDSTISLLPLCLYFNDKEQPFYSDSLRILFRNGI